MTVIGAFRQVLLDDVRFGGAIAVAVAVVREVRRMVRHRTRQDAFDLSLPLGSQDLRASLVGIGQVILDLLALQFFIPHDLQVDGGPFPGFGHLLVPDLHLFAVLEV